MKRVFDESLKQANTKEKIIVVSIQEFATKGYDNTSIREIAEIVGIKGSSIYNHFNSKEEILEEIFKYYRKNFYQGELVFDINKGHIKENSIPAMLKQGLYSVVATLKKPEITNILNIIIKEQFKNQKIREFFWEEFIEKPRSFMENFLVELMEKGLIKKGDPHLLSQEFHAFSIYKMYEEFMLKNMNSIDMGGLQKQISEHIDFFWDSITNK